MVGYARQPIAHGFRGQLLDASIGVGIGRLDVQTFRQRGNAFDLEALDRRSS
jgi:hypothetical protein